MSAWEPALNGDVVDDCKEFGFASLVMQALSRRLDNTLAATQTVARLCFKSADIPHSVIEDFDLRMHALARAYDLMQRPARLANLRDLVEQSLSPYLSPRNAWVCIEGFSTSLSARERFWLGLVIPELARLSAAYGALSDDVGLLRVQWRKVSQPRKALLFTWTERALYPNTLPSKFGADLDLVEAAIEQGLGGSAKTNFAPDGISIAIEIDRTQIFS